MDKSATLSYHVHLTRQAFSGPHADEAPKHAQRLRELLAQTIHHLTTLHRAIDVSSGPLDLGGESYSLSMFKTRLLR
jgi:hypothetical protein